jgi:nucleotide-binding universal stress UspA family protein
MDWLPKKCIVVPFDFSEQADQALESSQVFTSDLAGLHVVHVLPTIELAEPGVIWETIDDDARRHHVEAAFRERFTKSPFATVDFHVRFGDPGREIAALAEELHAELIVMPSHGRTGLSRLFIGSVAERVVRLAHCPVLILK